MTGYQINIGYTDVKSADINFYVRYYGDFNQGMARKPIPFNYEIQNVGGAMNGELGIFTVPRTGTYYLSATGTARFPYSEQKIRLNFGIGMFRNGNGIGWARSTDLVDAYKSESFSIQLTVNLKKGDQIFLQLDSGHLSAGVFPCDSLFFTGYLLQEEISQSLNIAF